MLRGPLIGSTFQGTLYDKKGRMDMTGTFMPAYGLNRIFGEIRALDLGFLPGFVGERFRLKPNLKLACGFN